MRKLAWQKLAPLLLCGLVATGCEQDKNSLTDPINWQSILSESLADLDIENISVDQLLGILNSRLYRTCHAKLSTTYACKVCTIGL